MSHEIALKIAIQQRNDALDKCINLETTLLIERDKHNNEFEMMRGGLEAKHDIELSAWMEAKGRLEFEIEELKKIKDDGCAVYYVLRNGMIGRTDGDYMMCIRYPGDQNGCRIPYDIPESDNMPSDPNEWKHHSENGWDVVASGKLSSCLWMAKTIEKMRNF